MPGALAFSTLRSPHSSPSAGRCLLCPCPCYRCLRCCAPAAARVARKGLNGAARGTSTTAVQCTCSTRGRASGHIFSFELESDTHFRPQSVRRAIRIRSTVWFPTSLHSNLFGWARGSRCSLPPPSLRSLPPRGCCWASRPPSFPPCRMWPGMGMGMAGMMPPAMKSAEQREPYTVFVSKIGDISQPEDLQKATLK